MKLTVPASQAFLDYIKQKEYEELIELRNEVLHLKMVNEELREQLTMCHKMHTASRNGKVN